MYKRQLFHWDEERGAYEAEHQPFTLPSTDDLEAIKADPLAAGSCTYDFVMDGYEAGGGGMRIHNSEMQLAMLEMLGFTIEGAREQFGFLMDALEFGAPPMGGFALGLDRVCMLLAGADSIREVMEMCIRDSFGPGPRSARGAHEPGGACG